MRKHQSSLTAEGIAWSRAMESRRPEGERICHDPYAELFLGGLIRSFDRIYLLLGRLFGQAWLWERLEQKGPGVFGFIVTRVRYMDDYLQRCLDQGIQQLVLLGAGLDSRAYRFPQLQHDVKVFEVDHPASQSAKLAKLKRLVGVVPPHVTYVSVDFSTQTLAERLLGDGYDTQVRTLFIWEGVVCYLTPQAVDSTLAFVAQNSGPGSTIIFDYLYRAALEGRAPAKEVARMQRFRGLSNEGLVFGIEEHDIGRFLSERGFDQITDADHRRLESLYMTGPNAHRTVSPNYGIVHARVKPRA